MACNILVFITRILGLYSCQPRRTAQYGKHNGKSNGVDSISNIEASEQGEIVCPTAISTLMSSNDKSRCSKVARRIFQGVGTDKGGIQDIICVACSTSIGFCSFEVHIKGSVGSCDSDAII